jgi:hypothetical protein
MSPPPPFRLD